MAHVQFANFEIELMKDLISDRLEDHLSTLYLALHNKDVGLGDLLIEEMHAALELLRTVDLGSRGDGSCAEPARVQARKSDRSATCNRESMVNEAKGALFPPVPLKLVPAQPDV
jgi:hypothetical protein